MGMQTWKLVPRPLKRKIIKSKWVFKVKRRPDHSIQKLKARLVAMGYSQVHGLDYQEVLSPTLCLETLRLILSLLASNNWKGQQVDFKTAFFNGRLDHFVYMEQPPGFEDPDHPEWVYQLDRSLYGLKQSPRKWNTELHRALMDLGLCNSKYDPILYFQIQNNCLVGALTAHDDLAIVCEPSFVDPLIKSLGEKFQIGADEDIHHFLSLRISHDRNSHHVFLNQSHYIEDLCHRFLDGKHTPVATPTDINFKSLNRRTSLDSPASGPHKQLVGSLLWVSQCTQPDVAFAVNRLSQHLCDPSQSHYLAAIRVLNYLVSKKDLKLRLGGKLTFSGYSDSDWAEDRDDRKSTSAYTYRIGDGAVSWKSRKQATVSLSSTKAEYKALSDSCKEGLWLRNLLTELHLHPRTTIPSMSTTREPKLWPRTLNIIQEPNTSMCGTTSSGSVYRKVMFHISTKDMLADMLTKPLPRVPQQKTKLLPLPKLTASVPVG